MCAMNYFYTSGKALRPVYTGEKNGTARIKSGTARINFHVYTILGPFQFYPFRSKKGSIGAYGPFSERNGYKLVPYPLFLLSIPTCKCSSSFRYRSPPLLPESAFHLPQLFTVNRMRFTPYMFAAKWRREC